jgi:hypothetical protein
MEDMMATKTEIAAKKAANAALAKKTIATDKVIARILADHAKREATPDSVILFAKDVVARWSDGDLGTDTPWAQELAKREQEIRLRSKEGAHKVLTKRDTSGVNASEFRAVLRFAAMGAGSPRVFAVIIANAGAWSVIKIVCRKIAKMQRLPKQEKAASIARRERAKFGRGSAGATSGKTKTNDKRSASTIMRSMIDDAKTFARRFKTVSPKDMASVIKTLGLIGERVVKASTSSTKAANDNIAKLAKMIGVAVPKPAKKTKGKKAA